jgi:hypothetical protein
MTTTTSNYPLTTTQIAHKYQVSPSLVQKFARKNNVPCIGSGYRRTYVFDREHDTAFKNRDQQRGRKWNVKICVIQHPEEGQPKLHCFYHIKDAFIHAMNNGAFYHSYTVSSQKFSGIKKGFFARASEEEKEEMKTLMEADNFSGKLFVWAAAPGTKKYFFDNEKIDRMTCVQVFFSYRQNRVTMLCQQAQEPDEDFINRLYEANKGPGEMSRAALKKELFLD